MTVKLVPVGEFKWTNDHSFMRVLTCVNHQDARYLTKNPFIRSLRIVELPKGDIERTLTGECTCPFSDLRVMVEEPSVHVNRGEHTSECVDGKCPSDCPTVWS